MISSAGTLNNRQIIYADISEQTDLQSLLPLKNWLLFIIADDITNPLLEPFAAFCIDNDVQYVCAAGKACSEADDLFDELMVCRELDKKYLPAWIAAEDDVLMTTWHHSFDESFWYAACVADYEGLCFDTILAANLTGQDYRSRITDLISRISHGSFPGE